MTSRDTTALITLRGLVTARWVLIGILGLVIVFRGIAPEMSRKLVAWLPDIPSPGLFVGTAVMWGLVNVLTQLWVFRGRRVLTWMAGKLAKPLMITK